jgi:hypothetical protein
MPHPSSPPQDPPRARLASLSHPRTLALIAIAIGLLLRVPGMLQSLWLDEIFRTRVGLASDRLSWLLFYDVHNPLYNALMWVWIRLAGDSEIAVRLPSLIAALAIVALIWRWVVARFGAAAGCVAGVWLLLSPVAVWYSTEAKNNIFTVLFATAGVCLIDVAMRSRRTRDVALAAAACVLAVATDFQSLLVLAPAWIAVAWFGVAGAYGASDSAKSRAVPGLIARLAPLLFVIASALAFLVPWVIFKSGHASELPRPYVGYLHWHEVLRLLIIWLPTGNAFPPIGRGWILNGAWIGLLVLPLVLAGLFRLARTPAGVLALVGLFGPPLLMMVANEVLVATGTKTRLYQPRNLLVMLPWFAVALGAGAAAWRDWKSRGAGQIQGEPSRPRRTIARLTPHIIIAPLALALVSTILIRTTQSERETVITPNPDWRGLAEWNREGTEVPIIANTMVLPLEYYAPGLRAFQVQGAEDRIARIHTIVRDERLAEFIFAHNPHWYPPMTDEEIAQALSVGEVVGRAHFQSFDAWRVRVRDVVITPSP